MADLQVIDYSQDVLRSVFDKLQTNIELVNEDVEAAGTGQTSVLHRVTNSGTYDFNSRNGVDPIGNSLIEEIQNDGSMTIANAPTGFMSGSLLQIQLLNSDNVMQLCFIAGGTVYQRYSFLANSVKTWSSWAKLWMGTLGHNSGLEADKVDGYHAYSFGIKDGSLQTNLNSEMVGGKEITDLTLLTTFSSYKVNLKHKQLMGGKY